MSAASSSGSHGKDLNAEMERAGRALIANSRLFHDVSTARREALLARVGFKRFGARETIFQQGERGDELMVIISGDVAITVLTEDGHEVLIAIMHSGEVFGEIAVFDRKERTACATAMTPVILAVIQERDLRDLLEAQPDVYPRLIELLCDRIRRTTRQMAEIAALDIPTRLARTLLREASKSTDRLRLCQRDLAHLVGASRESVNKFLNVWQAEGIVRIKGNVVTIADRERLERVSGQSSRDSG